MSQDHPRRQPETIETLEQADLEGSLEFYRDRFADAGDFTFVFVGSLDLAAMRPLVERYLGGLPSTGREETWRDVGVRPPSGIVEETIYRGLEPVGRTRVAVTGPIELADVAERTLLAAATRVLQVRLRDVLREDLGATYNVAVSSGTAWRPEQTYSVIVEFTSDPARVDELVATVFAEIDALRSEGPTESQVADVREAMRREYELNLERNAYWVGLLAASYQFGFDTGEEWERAYPASIESLSPDTVRDAAQRYIDTESYVRLSLLPESMAPAAR
jgi:zinc protease